MLRNPKRFFQEALVSTDAGHGLQIANKVINCIKNQCLAFEVCGSIRRQSDVIHDIDIVCIPRDWYMCSVKCITLADKHKIRASPQLCRFIHDSIPVEIYFADTLLKYETLKMFRTGDQNFNKLLMHAAFEYDVELDLNTGGLWFHRGNKYLVAWTEEQIICELLDNYIPPEDRSKTEWMDISMNHNHTHPFSDL